MPDESPWWDITLRRSEATCPGTCLMIVPDEISLSVKWGILPRYVLNESLQWDITLVWNQTTFLGYIPDDHCGENHTICLDMCMMSLLDKTSRKVWQLAQVSAQQVSSMRHYLWRSKTTCQGMCSMSLPDKMPLSAEVRQPAWVCAQGPLLGKSDNLLGYVLKDYSWERWDNFSGYMCDCHSWGSKTTCLFTCAMSSWWDITLGEVRQLAWVCAQWLSQMIHHSCQKSYNLSRYMPNDHAQGSWTTYPGKCLMTTFREVRQLAKMCSWWPLFGTADNLPS